MEITELIINSKIMGESENWDFIEWKKYITEIILEVYSQGDFHNYILDQIICYCLPQFNQNRFSFKKNSYKEKSSSHHEYGSILIFDCLLFYFFDDYNSNNNSSKLKQNKSTFLI